MEWDEGTEAVGQGARGHGPEFSAWCRTRDEYLAAMPTEELRRSWRDHMYHVHLREQQRKRLRGDPPIPWPVWPNEDWESRYPVVDSAAPEGGGEDAVESEQEAGRTAAGSIPEGAVEPDAADIPVSAAELAAFQGGWCRISQRKAASRG